MHSRTLPSFSPQQLKSEMSALSSSSSPRNNSKGSTEGSQEESALESALERARQENKELQEQKLQLDKELREWWTKEEEWKREKEEKARMEIERKREQEEREQEREEKRREEEEKGGETLARVQQQLRKSEQARAQLEKVMLMTAGCLVRVCGAIHAFNFASFALVRFTVGSGGAEAAARPRDGGDNRSVDESTSLPVAPNHPNDLRHSNPSFECSAGARKRQVDQPVGSTQLFLSAPSPFSLRPCLLLSVDSLVYLSHAFPLVFGASREALPVFFACIGSSGTATGR